mmetsp:Transcript_41689/g.126443  ORF Transcript_41689/g.126443 Transcript_41689/m.126443 type:complete len:514 (+) Transcript_41689:2086-3627(+)
MRPWRGCIQLDPVTQRGAQERPGEIVRVGVSVNRRRPFLTGAGHGVIPLVPILTHGHGNLALEEGSSSRCILHVRVQAVKVADVGEAGPCPHGCPGQLVNVRPPEQLHGALTEVSDLILGGLPQPLVLDAGHVDGPVVRQVEENIMGVDRLGTLLLPAEDEIDPGGELGGAHVGLKGGAHHLDEFFGGAAGPGGQHHVAQHLAVLGLTQLEGVGIPQEGGVAVPLGGQFLHLGGGGARAHVPRAGNAREQSIGDVKVPRLELPVQPRKGMESDQEMTHHPCCRGVMRSVHEGRDASPEGISHGLKSIEKLGETIGVEGTHRLGQISKVGWVRQIGNVLGGVIAQHPGHDRILTQIVVAPSCQHIETHQIVKIGHSALDPRHGQAPQLLVEELTTLFGPLLHCLGRRAFHDGVGRIIPPHVPLVPRSEVQEQARQARVQPRTAGGRSGSGDEEHLERRIPQSIPAEVDVAQLRNVPAQRTGTLPGRGAVMTLHRLERLLGVVRVNVFGLLLVRA